MTANTNQVPDWSTIDLSPAHQEHLQYLYDMETMYHISRAAGMAFLGYIRAESPSSAELNDLCLAWHHFFYVPIEA